ncbi:MAG: radical SAM protein [Microbacter sp.]
MELVKHVFGPVPSRRLGQSIGINNIPPKICTYACPYCQIGKAIKMQLTLQPFYPPPLFVDEVKETLNHLSFLDQKPDYLTIVPDGEPTLDSQLSELIRQLKFFNIPIAIITNGSLLYLREVQEALFQCDYVSVKVDSVIEPIWRAVNKPVKSLSLKVVLGGIEQFSHHFQGRLVTETMLLKEVNDSLNSVRATADFIHSLNPVVAYIGIPTRPTALQDVFPADEEAVNRTYQIYSERIPQVELLTGYEGNAFSSVGDFEADLLSITAVHPMREDAVIDLLNKTMTSADRLNKLLEQGVIKKIFYNDHFFYVRRFRS